MKEKLDRILETVIVKGNPIVGVLATFAIILAALIVPECEMVKRVIWALIVTVPPAWLALEWSYRFTDKEKEHPEKRAAIVRTQELYSRFWLAAATGIGLLYFGGEALSKLASVLKE